MFPSGGTGRVTLHEEGFEVAGFELAEGCDDNVITCDLLESLSDDLLDPPVKTLKNYVSARFELGPSLVSGVVNFLRKCGSGKGGTKACGPHERSAVYHPRSFSWPGAANWPFLTSPDVRNLAGASAHGHDDIGLQKGIKDEIHVFTLLSVELPVNSPRRAVCGAGPFDLNPRFFVGFD